MTVPGEIPLSAREEALAWFVRLQDDACPLEDWRAFHAWLDGDPERAAAYDEIEALWVDAEAAAPVVAAVAVSPSPPLPPRRVRLAGSAQGRRRTRWIAAAAALAACATLALFVAPRLAPPPKATIYATAVGQTRAVELADGSHLVLNSGTRLSVTMAGSSRSVILDQGEATFDVAHEAQRPFVITAGDRRITDIGTEFNVLRTGGRLTVTVRKGAVAVDPAANAAGASLQLIAGQQLLHRSGEASSAVSSVDPERAFGWRTGRLIYQARPLREVADDLGRYFPRPIRVDDSIAQMPFTGVLRLDEQEALVRRLEMFLPVHAQITPREIRLSPSPKR